MRPFVSFLFGKHLSKAMSLSAMMVVLIIYVNPATAQMKVGNNPTTIDASSMLEVEATNQGILLPRISIGNINTWGLAGATPVNGMFVYNSNAATTGGSGIGIYYWANAKWNYVQNGAASNTAWLLTGNASTTPGTYAAPGTNFIGTTDGVDFAVRTTNAERMRISAAGQIGINQNFQATQQLAVTTGVAANTAVVGQNTTASGAGAGIGVSGSTLQSGGYGVKGTNGNAGGIAILGQNTVAAGTGGNGIGVEGISSQAYNSGTGTNGYGLAALNNNSLGTGLYAAGNNLGLNNNYLLNGSGASLVGTNVGGFGYATTNGGYGLYGSYNTSLFGTGVLGIGYNAVLSGDLGLTDIGVYGSANNAGLYGYNATGGYALFGVNTNGGTTGYLGNSGTGSSTFGVVGEVTYAGNKNNLYYPVAVYGNASANSNANGTADGVDGITNQPGGAGVFGINAYGNTGATGVFGSQFSNAGTPFTLQPVSGSGGSFTGNGTNTNDKTIIGVAGFANYGTNAAGAGTGANPSYFAGGYFATRISQVSPYAATTYAYVAAQINGVQYKINGTGTVSTIVNDMEGGKVNFFAPEAPEILFEDYGRGVLKNGKAHIILDPIYAKNIAVNDKHPLRVFIQLNGDCNGVFVTNKNGFGFDVIELKNGNSNVEFEWHVVGNRADEKDKDGLLVSKNADIRMPPAPMPLESMNLEGKNNSILQSQNNIKKSGLLIKGTNDGNEASQKILTDKAGQEQKQKANPPVKKMN